MALQVIIWVILYYFSQQSHQWNLNKTVGWGWDITNYIWWMPLLVKYFAANIFIGIILIFPVWNQCVKYQLQN